MKALLASLCMFTVALAATAAPATAPAVPAAFPVKEIFARNGELIQTGVSERAVRQSLGAPHRQLNPEVCLYYGFKADLELANERDCRILMVTYAGGKVVDLKLVNLRAAKVIAANPTRISAMIVAAK